MKSFSDVPTEKKVEFKELDFDLENAALLYSSWEYWGVYMAMQLPALKNTDDIAIPCLFYAGTFPPLTQRE